MHTRPNGPDNVTGQGVHKGVPSNEGITGNPDDVGVIGSVLHALCGYWPQLAGVPTWLCLVTWMTVAFTLSGIGLSTLSPLRWSRAPRTLSGG